MTAAHSYPPLSTGNDGAPLAIALDLVDALARARGVPGVPRNDLERVGRSAAYVVADLEKGANVTEAVDAFLVNVRALARQFPTMSLVCAWALSAELALALAGRPRRRPTARITRAVHSRGSSMLAARWAEYMTRKERADLVAMLGVHPSLLSRYRRGLVRPSITHALAIERVLGVSVLSWNEPLA